MYVFIDTAVTGCHIALFNETEILGIESENIERGHAETLLPLYERLLTYSGKSAADIEKIFVTIGPGSFTGLRVGLTVARFIAFATGKPVFGVSTFEAFSAAVNDTADRMVLIETKRSDYYCQMLSVTHTPLGEAESIAGSEIAEILAGKDGIILTGDAVERFMRETALGNVKAIPQQSFDIINIIKAIQADELPLHEANAFYIRDADVTMPAK